MEKRASLTNHLLLGWLGIFFGLIGLIASLTLVLRSSGLRIRALPEETPQEVRLTNLTENSVTVSWLTAAPTLASVVYSSRPDLSSALTGFDERGADVRSTLHFVTLTNLQPNTAYYFRLISGGGSFDNQSKPYTFTTAPHISLTPAPPFVIKGKAGREALVYFSFNDSTSLATLADENGNYLLTLNNALTKNLQNYYPVQKREKGYLLINDGQSQTGREVVVEEEMTLLSQAEQEDLANLPPNLTGQLPKPDRTSFLLILKEKLQGLLSWLGGQVR